MNDLITSTPDDLDESILVLPISRSAQHLAAQFASQQPTAQKAEQVWFNTIAVCAVNDYCQMLDIPTALTAGDSWKPALQLSEDVADLELTGIGRLECRPVQPGQDTCYVPPEVWSNRIGYVVVQIDENALEATLLGFTKTVSNPALPIAQLQSLDDLIDQVHALMQPRSIAVSQQAVTQLGQWLIGQFDAGWQTLDQLLSTVVAPPPAFAMRGEIASDSSAQPRIRRAKVINLDTDQSSYPLLLLVELLPQDHQQSIYIQLHTIQPPAHLPEHLKLMVLDQSEAIVLETEARSTDNYIQLGLRGQPGEYFSVRVALGDASRTEAFLV
jgi:hypothetical protein